MRFLLAVLVVSLLAGAWLTWGVEDTDEPDFAAQRACSEFVELMRDGTAGLLSEDEINEQVRSIHNHARRSQEGLEPHADRLLRETNQGRITPEATSAFGQRCEQLGLTERR